VAQLFSFGVIDQMSTKTKFVIVLSVLVCFVLALGVRNFIRMRSATAHNAAIDSLRQTNSVAAGTNILAPAP
jgi:hypothetical protein